MNLIEVILALFSVLCLVANQVLVKMWLLKRSISVWPINKHFFYSLFSWEIGSAGFVIVISSLIWVYLLERIEFSLLYPIISLSYVFGLLAGKFIFGEQIPATRWVGVIIIIIGVLIVNKN